MINEGPTIEQSYGWVFFYNSRRYLETGDIMFAFAGNGPVVVERKDGTVTELGSGRSVEDELRDFEIARDKR